MEFNLRIELGNGAMRDPQDVGDALMKVAQRLIDGAEYSASTGSIRDTNGNTVGCWEFTDEHL